MSYESDDEFGPPNLGTYDGDRNEEQQRHGEGKAALFRGGDVYDHYEGSYENGLRHGYGVYRFASGARYEGEYARGLKRGKGVFYYPDGAKYDGYWLDDRRDGEGTYTYPNGDTYVGEWRMGQKWGAGEYTYLATGSKYRGQWVRGKRDGRGEWIHKDHFYLGQYVNDKPLGVGMYTFNHGCRVHGSYKKVAVARVEDDYDDEVEAQPAEVLQWEGVKFELVDTPQPQP